jgi:hypothetical protein
VALHGAFGSAAFFFAPFCVGTPCSRHATTPQFLLVISRAARNHKRQR